MNMLITLGVSLEKQDKYLVKINTYIHENIVSKNNMLKELFNNIEYVKNQSNDIIRTLREIKSVLKNQNLLEKVMTNLGNRYREIRQLLEELKQAVIT